MSAGDDPEFVAWINERNRAFRELDVAWARAQAEVACARTGRPLPSDETLLASLHKARYDCWHIEPELRHASGAWLRERGLGRSCGLPLLPEGQLEYAHGEIR